MKIFGRWLCLLVLIAVSCSHWTKGSSVDSQVLAFYNDQMDVTTLIQEEDSPQRQASMRLLSDLLKNGRGDVSGDYENLLKVDGHNPYAYYYLAKSLAAEQRLDKAQVMARRAEQLFGKDPVWKGKALVLQARVQVSLEQTEAARRLYEKARILDPKNPLVDEGLRNLPMKRSSTH